jgi:hypothetical protein
LGQVEDGAEKGVLEPIKEHLTCLADSAFSPPRPRSNPEPKRLPSFCIR